MHVTPENLILAENRVAHGSTIFLYLPDWRNHMLVTERCQVADDVPRFIVRHHFLQSDDVCVNCSEELRNFIEIPVVPNIPRENFELHVFLGRDLLQRTAPSR